MSLTKVAQDFPFEKIKQLFADSLCGFNFQLDKTGYWNPCQINTYLLALPQILLLAYVIPKVGDAPGGGATRTKLKNFKMGLAALHVATTSLYGPEVFNVISLTVSYTWLFVCFLCAFMELNGLFIPRKALLGYYFVCSLGYGYYICAAVARRVDIPNDPRLHAAVFLFLTSFINACMRDIGDAVETNETPTEIPTVKN